MQLEQKIINELAQKYCETLEEFLKTLGITQENHAEYQLQENVLISNLKWITRLKDHRIIGTITMIPTGVGFTISCRKI